MRRHFQIIITILFCFCSVNSHAQADTLDRQRHRDSTIAAQKKQLAAQRVALQKARSSNEDSVYKEHPPLPFSYEGTKAITYSLTTLPFTNYVCLSADGRFRFVSFHEGPVTLSEGQYKQKGDKLILTPASRPSVEFINAYKNYREWGYMYDAACKWIFNTKSGILRKKCN